MPDPKKKLTITRLAWDSDGTRGVTIFNGKTYQTLELRPDHNEADLSCILGGTYNCNLRLSHHFERNLFHVDGVQNRTEVMIHNGNYAGDTTKGKRSDVLGCILVGSGWDVAPSGQKMVTGSKVALAELMEALGTEDFTLEILWANGEPPEMEKEAA